MNFKSVSFESECPTIHYAFQIKRSTRSTFQSVLIASFSGKYRHGSAGNPDASYMWGLLKTAIELWNPKAVIIDLHDLEYSWGDRMEEVFSAPEDEYLAIVVGPKNRKALSTLILGLDTKKDVTENKLFYDSLDDALNYLEQYLG
ncbi:MAG: hypothetical protein KJ069_30095 [Anaerolineae bacterium]|nr:hypothetical protein [Anaerolineae bacterium]